MDYYKFCLHNGLANEIIESHFIKELEGYKVVKREYSFGRSRLDFLLAREGERMLLEVKGCTLLKDDMALFPDAPTTR